MAMSISELQGLCGAQGVELPELREVATAVDGAPVHAGEVDGIDAFRLWSQVRSLHDRSGWWPVLAGEPGSLGNVLVGLDPAFAPAKGRADGALPDARTLLDEWARESVRFLPSEAAAERDVARALRRLAAHVADKVDLDHVGGLSVTALREERTVVCLVQAPSGSDVPSLLNWQGACNYDISGAEHSAILRHFDARYGAELVTLAGSVLEVLVTRRPRTPETVAAAALEHYAYCNDIVHQGTGSIEELINGQLRSSTWYFWWD